MPHSLNAEERKPFRGRVARGMFLVVFLAGLATATAQAAPVIAALSGNVFVLKSGTREWRLAAQSWTLSPGDQVRTVPGSRATITFDDGSRINLGPNASFTMQEASAGGISLKLAIGSLRAWVSKALSRRFEVRTPTAVCAVRGTEFSVDVNVRGHTGIQMFSGILAVADQRGHEVLIRDHESLLVTDRGLAAGPRPKSAQTAAARERLRDVARREVGLEMSKEAVQTAAAIEAMNAVYKEGKAIIDVNGNRVRMEEYIVRPAPDQFKLVVLNERVDRFDYFYYHGIFNTALPDDLSLALRELPGCIGNPCPYYLTGYDTGRSNTVDNMLEVTSGGHQVDVNNNGVAADLVSAAFDPGTNQVTALSVPNPGGVGNQSFYHTLYNNYSLTFNGVEHGKWTPAAGAIYTGAEAYNVVGCTVGQPCIRNMDADLNQASGGSYTTVQSPPACAPPDCTYNEAGVEHQVVYAVNNGGDVWEKYDNYIISDEGHVANTADFAGSYSGAWYKQTLMRWNFETIVTASEFNGRKIDLAVEPKIFIESGLIP